MKKTFGFFSIIWAIFLALFNVIVFVTPNEAGGMTKFGGAFWVGYIFITIAFIGQLVCAFFAFKPSDKQKVFYNIPLVTISYAGLIVMLIAGTTCMAIPNLPNWIGIIVCLLALAITSIAVLVKVEGQTCCFVDHILRSVDHSRNYVRHQNVQNERAKDNASYDCDQDNENLFHVHTMIPPVN